MTEEDRSLILVNFKLERCLLKQFDEEWHQTVRYRNRSQCLRELILAYLGVKKWEENEKK